MKGRWLKGLNIFFTLVSFQVLQVWSYIYYVTCLVQHIFCTGNLKRRSYSLLLFSFVLQVAKFGRMFFFLENTLWFSYILPKRKINKPKIVKKNQMKMFYVQVTRHSLSLILYQFHTRPNKPHFKKIIIEITLLTSCLPTHVLLTVQKGSLASGQSLSTSHSESIIFIRKMKYFKVIFYYIFGSTIF